ncbi:hypothetical protein ACHAWF_018551 [Thalassiosira exigua]
MRRLVPFVLAALMACLPPLLLMALIGVGEPAAGPQTCALGACVDVLAVDAPSAGMLPPRVVAGGNSGGKGVGGIGAVMGTGGAGGGFVVGGVHAASAHAAAAHRYHRRPASTVAASVTSAAMAYFAPDAAASGTPNHQPLSPGQGGGGGTATAAADQRTPQQGHVRHARVTGSAATYVAEAPPDTLKVSVLGASKGRSASCAYSLVEFQNTHHSDTIIVHSAYIEPTAMFPSQSTDDPPPPSPPPPFHKEFYEDRQLKVPPRTAVTVPVSVIPHCRKPPENLDWHNPHRTHHRNLDTAEGGGASPLSSSTDQMPYNATGHGHNPAVIRANLLDIMTNYRQERAPPSGGDALLSPPPPDRAALLESVAVHETLVAYTSWGFVQMKVPYVCSPAESLEYEFGLPNNLMFLDGGGGWYARRNTTPTVELSYLFGDWTYNPTRDPHDPFIYGLFMENPTGEELHIWEVSTTKPWLVVAERRSHGNKSAWADSHNPFMEASQYFPLRTPKELRSNPPKTTNIYVATIRLRYDQFTPEMMDSLTVRDLGFLEMRTNLGTFSVALDFVPNGGRGGVIHGVGENRTTMDDMHLVRDQVMDELLEGLEAGESHMRIAKTYRPTDRVSENLTNSLDLFGNENRILGENEASDLSAAMMASPMRINFGSITTGSRTVRIPLKVSSRHHRQLRLMRISVATSTLSDDGNGNVTDISGETRRMEIGVEFNGSQMPPFHSTGDGTYGKEVYLLNELVFPGYNPDADNYEATFHVWCKFNASPGDTIRPRFYTGSILVQASEDILGSYPEWEEKVLLEHSSELLSHRGVGGGGGGGGRSSGSNEIRPSSARFTLEIPFAGSVLPGNLGSQSEGLMFPTHFSSLSASERVTVLKATGGKTSAQYDRKIDVTNNFAVPITVVGMSILDSSNSDDFCQQRFSTEVFDKAGAPVTIPASTGDDSRGMQGREIILRYRFVSDEEYAWGGPMVRKCILALETDRAGRQSLPLIVYNGELMVDLDSPDVGTQTVHCLVKRPDRPGATVSRSGMPCLAEWAANTVEGQVLASHVTKRATCNKRRREDPLVQGYFRNMVRNQRKHNAHMPHHALQPVVVSFGAIGTGESATRTVILHNLNHAPVEVMASSAVLGNLRVAMRSNHGAGMMDHLPHRDGLDDVTYFLRHSPAARAVLAPLQYKFDIQHSTKGPSSGINELSSLFDRYYVVDVFENATEYIEKNYIQDKETSTGCACGYVLSTDGSYEREICQHRKGKKPYVIPPGGQARFEVTVEAPPRSELRSDVTSFVATGLALETDHGQALPIVVTYSAVAGRLELKPVAANGIVSTSVSHAFNDAVPVPVTYRGSDIAPAFVVHEALRRYGVPLTLESTFSRDIDLSDVQTCNKWHHVMPRGRDSNLTTKTGSMQLRIAGTGVEGVGELGRPTAFPLGTLLSALSCSHPSGDTSFYACALAWLEGRNEIQAPGCGMSEVETVKSYLSAIGNLTDVDEGDLAGRIQEAKSNAIGSLRDVVAFLSVRYADSSSEDEGKSPPADAGKSTGSAYIHSSRIHMFEHARKTWDEVVSLGLNAITGRINARTLYHGPDGQGREWGAVAMDDRQATSTSMFSHQAHIRGGTMGETHPPLSIPVSSQLLRGELVIPQLFRHGGNGDFDDGKGRHGSNKASNSNVNNENSHSDQNVDVDSFDNKGHSAGPAVVDFSTVHVADITAVYVPVSNPTAHPIRVKLAAAGSVDGAPDGRALGNSKNVFVRGDQSDRHSWWTGGGYWMADGRGRPIGASHNVTIKSGAGAFVSLLNPALHAMNAFVLGCGKRCGLRDDGASSSTVAAGGSAGEERNFSPVGAAAGSGRALLGRSPEQERSVASGAKGVKPVSPQRALSLDIPPAFALAGRGASGGSSETVVPPYGSAELGPVYFRPPGRGSYEGTIYLENSLTGFEEVTVRGRGGWEHLVFLDETSNETKPDGGDVEFRFGKSTLVFPGSHTGLQLSSEEGGFGPVLRSVRLANKGEMPVDITHVYMASSEVMHFTHKRRHPSTLFKTSQGSREDEAPQCNIRGFMLPGCSEPPSGAWAERLLLWCTRAYAFFHEKILLASVPSSGTDDGTESTTQQAAARLNKFYKEGFTLEPNQTQTVYIAHYPDCTFQTSYASVIFEIGDRSKRPDAERHRAGSWQQTFRKRRAELLVGYDMSASEYRNCVPYAPAQGWSGGGLWEQKMEFQFPNIVHDVLSFGLTRLTDADGIPYVPRRPIEVTLLAAAFVILLLVLSLDLLFSVEVCTGDRKCSANWKPTCRCLARSDPTSSELASIGRDQTKHVLLSRFKKEGVVLPSSCVQPDGSLGRGSRLGGSGGTGGTHSEPIFDRLNLAHRARTDEEDGHHDGENDTILHGGVLPCGLGWRTALRRGIGHPGDASSGSPELQYLTRTRERYLKKQQERKLLRKAASAVSTPAKARDHTAATADGNGHSAFTKPVPKSAILQDRKMEGSARKKVQIPANGRNVSDACNHPAPLKSSSNMSDSSSVTSSFSGRSSGVAKTPDKNYPANVAKASEAAKFKNQQKVGAGAGAMASYVPTQTKVVVGKKNQRTDVKPAKSVKKQDESNDSKQGKMAANQKTRAAKPAVGISPSHEEKTLQEYVAPLSSSKEVPPAQVKSSRQTKKPTNGSKSPEQQTKGKQGKQKGTARKASAKNPPKSPLSITRSPAQQPKSDSDFPPLRAAPQAQSPVPNKSKQLQSTRQKASVRPPPGLLAPPGFVDQPDIDGLSNHSSPMSSPQRSSVQRSPMVQSMPTTISGMEIMPSPPLNTDLLSLIGGEEAKPPVERTLFHTQPSDSSYHDHALSMPQFRPQSFTPPDLEQSPTGDTNASEPPEAVRALLGAGSNFNVSNFLDGILSESTQGQQPPAQKPAQVAEPIPFVQAQNIGVSLDPWNNSEESKRSGSGSSSGSANPLAALRGASDHGESSVIAGIPLNSQTPSLLSTVNATYAKPAYASLISDDGADEGDFVEPDSFYNQLLGEE